jgi:Bacterial SH3 domain
VAACTSGGGHSAPPGPSTTTTSAPSSTAPGAQTTGVRTVLSPIGLNVRAQPDKTAKVLGTAAQGVVLTVLGHTDAAGGWYQVKGATVTGWISGDPSLSAAGEFSPYTSAQFSALYPATWSSSPSPFAIVVFRPSTGPDQISATAAPTVAQLPAGRTGYGEVGSSQIVVCGVTSVLVTYQNAQATATTSSNSSVPVSTPYLGEVRIAVDPHHALGFYADLSGLGAPLDVFHSFLYSVTFASTQCTGG